MVSGKLQNKSRDSIRSKKEPQHTLRLSGDIVHDSIIPVRSSAGWHTPHRASEPVRAASQ